LRIRFGAEQGSIVVHKYDGKGRPVEHLEKFITQWRMTPPEEWPHHFIHTLEGIPGNWYIDQEMCICTIEWRGLKKNFVVNFSFEHENPNIDSNLKLIRGVIFFDEPEVEIITEYQQHNR
jgi:hypothetical protein